MEQKHPAVLMYDSSAEAATTLRVHIPTSAKDGPEYPSSMEPSRHREIEGGETTITEVREYILHRPVRSSVPSIKTASMPRKTVAQPLRTFQMDLDRLQPTVRMCVV